MSDIDKARTTAWMAHYGATDKGGEPYYGHAMRVAYSPRLKTDAERAAGYLHDVLEDTHVTANHLRDLGISELVVTLVKILTRGEDEPYFDYIARVGSDARTTRIKLADIDDNLDESRWPGGLPASLKARYLKAKSYLES